METTLQIDFGSLGTRTSSGLECLYKDIPGSDLDILKVLSQAYLDEYFPVSDAIVWELFHLCPQLVDVQQRGVSWTMQGPQALPVYQAFLLIQRSPEPGSKAINFPVQEDFEGDSFQDVVQQALACAIAYHENPWDPDL